MAYTKKYEMEIGMIVERILAIKDVHQYGAIAPNFALMHQMIYGSTPLTASVVGVAFTTGLIYSVSAIVAPAVNDSISSKTGGNIAAKDLQRKHSTKPDHIPNPKPEQTPKPKV